VEFFHPSPARGVLHQGYRRGSVLAIIDLAERLGLPSMPLHGTSVVVVIEHGERLIGLLVNAVSDIITATDEMYHATPDRQAAFHCKKTL
jgi:purine-binding chemotaxis protein CheW